MFSIHSALLFTLYLVRKVVPEKIAVATARNTEGAVWLKASELREQVAKLLGQPVEQLGHAQWIAHILSRLHLLDNGRRKRKMDGVVYAIQRTAVIDMMSRYDVMPISNS